jgi:hypothetical protein
MRAGTHSHRDVLFSTPWRSVSAIAVIAFTLLTATVDAQSTAPLPIGAELAAPAVAAPTTPELDGHVIDDPAWRNAPVISGFWQTTPQEGEPASERTEVRVIFDRDTLFIGVIAYDREPAQIIVADSRRDSSLSDTDSFLVILDTYRDRQNGFVFGTNPAGIQYDGQVTNEGQGSGGGGGPGGAQGGSGGGFNINWDGDWQVRTSITAVGWNAEMAIPFRTLRYPADEAQTWGINFQRNIRRRNEIAFWAPLTRQYSLYRLSLAGNLTGLTIPRRRNLQLIPYALGEARQTGARPSGTANFGDVGADLKYGVTPSLTLDATYNTDFAQVEVDEQQINLDRFSLFFPEKRPFFLENAGLFAVGTSREAEIFFSRRIGIGPSGEEIPIVGGARLTGRVGTTNLGLLNIQTEGAGTTPGNNFSVARLNHELPNRSALGAIVVNRQGTGGLAPPDDYNRSYAVDGRLGIGVNGLISGFAAKTSTPGVDDSQHAYRLTSSYNSQAWTLGLGFSEAADNFNPEAGFLSRRGYRKLDASAFHRYRPASFGPFHELRPHVAMRSFWNFEGFHETFYMHMDQHWEMKAGHEFHTGVNLTREGLTAPFQIYPGVIVPAGTYDHAETQLVFFTNQGAPAAVNLNVTAGGFFGGTRAAISPTFRFRLGDAFNTELRLTRNDIRLPGGDFVTNLISSRVSYSFTPSVFIQSLVQYNDRADLWSTNLRLGWYHKGSTGFFIAYNDTHGLADSPLLRPDRSLIVKISRLFDVFAN